MIDEEFEGIRGLGGGEGERAHGKINKNANKNRKEGNLFSLDFRRISVVNCHVFFM